MLNAKTGIGSREKGKKDRELDDKMNYIRFRKEREKTNQKRKTEENGFK